MKLADTLVKHDIQLLLSLQACLQVLKTLTRLKLY